MQAQKQLLCSLSALQLESIVYACQRHQQALPDGSRAGFFIGGWALVGGGRWQQQRRRGQRGSTSPHPPESALCGAC